MGDQAKAGPGVDFGPLAGLIGRWEGDKGIDVAPDPDGREENPYYETITFEGVGNVENAESQRLVAVHYRQIVRRKSDREVFHDETGYWMWDRSAGVVMHSLVIPRAVGVLAGGPWDESSRTVSDVTLEVAARHDDPDWNIIQSPFMRENARTMEFRHQITVGPERLSYSETTIVEIYGKVFEHTDENALTRFPD